MKSLNCGSVESRLIYAVVKRTNSYSCSRAELMACSVFNRSDSVVRSTLASLNFGSQMRLDYQALARSKRSQFQCFYSRMDMGREAFTQGLAIANGYGERWFLAEESAICHTLYHVLMHNFELPLLEEWMPYLYEVLREDDWLLCWKHCVVCGTYFNEAGGMTSMGFSDPDKVVLIELKETFTNDVLSRVVSEGIHKKHIQVCEEEQKPLAIDKMDDYFVAFADEFRELVNQIAVPRIETDSRFHYAALKSMRLFCKQADAANGVMECLRYGKYGIMYMGMGVGKTILSLTSIEGFFTQKWMRRTGKTLEDAYRDPLAVQYRIAIMCPGHLVKDWKKTIEEQIPFAKVTIVRELEQLIQYQRQFSGPRERNGKEFFIMSMDRAKLDYQEQPVPYQIKTRKTMYSVCTNCGEDKKGAGRPVCRCGSTSYRLVESGNYRIGLVCPACGELAMPNVCKLKLDLQEANPTLPLQPVDFTAHRNSNDRCYYCGEPFWTPVVRNLGASNKPKRWIRYSHFKNMKRKERTSSWILRGHEQALIQSLGDQVKTLEDLKENQAVGVRRFSIARYIKQHMRGWFDVCILDEFHKFKASGSGQAAAATALIKASNKILCLTGTLMGGYAKDLYYNLWKIDPARMKAEGFSYEDSTKFSREYGVVSCQYEHIGKDDIYNVATRGRKTSQERCEPGISPLVFSKFLLDKTVYLEIEDMASQLPDLTEFVEIVPIEPDILAAYHATLDALKGRMFEPGGRKLQSTMLQFSLSYCDKPYDRVPLVHPDTGEAIALPEELVHYKETLTNKERRLLEIVRKELSQNRNCFVYCEYTASAETNITGRLRWVLEEHMPELQGRVAIVESMSPAPEAREAYIHQLAEEGYRVIICNPRIVETGIDFCFTEKGIVYNFPNIIFYQMGYSLFTLWQASCRAYRMNQVEDCHTYYMASASTIQVDVLRLMGAKKRASAVMQGRFSSEGLTSMARGIDAKSALVSSIMQGQQKADEESIRSAFEESNNMHRHDESLDDIITMPTWSELVGPDVVASLDHAFGQTLLQEDQQISMDFAEFMSLLDVAPGQEESGGIVSVDDECLAPSVTTEVDLFSMFPEESSITTSKQSQSADKPVAAVSNTDTTLDAMAQALLTEDDFMLSLFDMFEEHRLKDTSRKVEGQLTLSDLF